MHKDSKFWENIDFTFRLYCKCEDWVNIPDTSSQDVLSHRFLLEGTLEDMLQGKKKQTDYNRKGLRCEIRKDG